MKSHDDTILQCLRTFGRFYFLAMNMSSLRKRSCQTLQISFVFATHARNGVHRKLYSYSFNHKMVSRSALHHLCMGSHSPETVQCDRCKKFFHMSCVNPPLLAKPSRGYGWTCAPCSRKHEEEVDSHEGVRHATPVAPKPKTNAPPPRGRGRPRKDRVLAEKEENMEIKHFKMWSFRYFG